MSRWTQREIEINELNAIQQEGYESYSSEDVMERNPYPENTLEHEVFSDGWEDAQEDLKQ